MTPKDMQILINSASRDVAVIMSGCDVGNTSQEAVEIMYSSLLEHVVSTLVDTMTYRVDSAAVAITTAAIPGAVASPVTFTVPVTSNNLPVPAAVPGVGPSDNELWQRLFTELDATGNNWTALPSFWGNFTKRDGTPHGSPNFKLKDDTNKVLWINSKRPRDEFIDAGLRDRGIKPTV